MNITSSTIHFKSLLDCKKGTFFSLLSESYKKLTQIFPAYKNNLIKNWRETDSLFFEFPDTVGKCGFLSVIQDKIIGFASWDPTKGPDLGIVGHNCILPKFHGKSYGKVQIYEIIRILKEKNFLSVRVTTGDHQFFVPAQKMYESCGFIENRRFTNSTNPFFGEIEYSIKL